MLFIKEDNTHLWWFIICSSKWLNNRIIILIMKIFTEYRTLSKCRQHFSHTRFWRKKWNLFQWSFVLYPVKTSSVSLSLPQSKCFSEKAQYKLRSSSVLCQLYKIVKWHFCGFRSLTLMDTSLYISNFVVFFQTWSYCNKAKLKYLKQSIF